MATTSIWPINGNISKAIRYVSNPDKIDSGLFSSQGIQSLKDALYDKHNDLVRRKGPFDTVDQVLVKILRTRQKRRQHEDPDLSR